MSGWGIAGLSVAVALGIYVAGFFVTFSYDARHPRSRAKLLRYASDFYGHLPNPANSRMFRAWEAVDPEGVRLRNEARVFRRKGVVLYPDI